jgi:raffinose/stachyose/melibiose transport system permease protein
MTTPLAARHRRMGIGRVVAFLAVVLLVLAEVLPLVWLGLSSVKAPDEFSTQPMWALPRSFHWENYRDAWVTGNMGTYLKNSVLATVPALVLLVAIGVMAGFALEVMRWKGRNAVLLTFVAGLMVPLQMVILPLFTMYYRAHLLDSLLSLIITYTAFGLPLTVFLVAGYYKAVPRELLEAGLVDGAGVYRVFWSISLPTIRNAVLTVALVQFFFIWNDLILTLTFISDDSKRTIQAGLLNFVGQYGQTEWGPTFASICMSIVPTLAIYLVLNQKVLKGLTAGAIKG